MKSVLRCTHSAFSSPHSVKYINKNRIRLKSYNAVTENGDMKNRVIHRPC